MKKKYKIFHESYLGDEPHIIETYSHYDAAIEYAEYYNTNSDYVLNDNSIEIVVQDEIFNRLTFRIGAQPTIDYTADEI